MVPKYKALAAFEFSGGTDWHGVERAAFYPVFESEAADDESDPYR